MLNQDSDPGGSLFVFTICNACERDDTKGEDKLWAEGWRWMIYAETEGEHYCPDCAPKHYRPEDDES